MKAVIFTRVSSVGQEEGVSLDAQEAKLFEYCKEKRFETLEVFRVVESSTRGDRKQFHKALNLIQKQKACTVLLVHSIDRLMRGFKEYGLIQTLIEQGKLEIHAYNERLVINKNTPWTDQLQFDFSIIGAKMYIGQLRQHVLKAMDFKLEHGEVVGRVPTGYLNHRDPELKKATVILDNERAFLVKRLFQEYSTGTFTYSEIATKAKQWGLTSPHSKKPLSFASIAKMLQNPFYMGKMLINGTLYPHVYPVLIEPSLFEQCQKVRKASSSISYPEQQEQGRKDQRAKKPFVFRGLIRCKECGCQICSDIKKGQYVYLFCTKAKGKDKCSSSRIREEVAMAEVERVLEQINIPELLIEQIQARLIEQYDQERLGIRATEKSLQIRYNEFNNQLDRLMNIYLTGSITQDAYDKKRLQLEAEKQIIAQQLSDCSKDDSEFRDSFVTLLRVVSKAAQTFKSSKVEQKRKIISFVFSNLWLEGQKISYELNRPFDKLIALSDKKVWWSIGDSNS